MQVDSKERRANVFVKTITNVKFVAYVVIFKNVTMQELLNYHTFTVKDV